MQIYLPVEGEDVKFAGRRSECNLVRNGMTHSSYKVQNTLVSLEGAETLWYIPKPEKERIKNRQSINMQCVLTVRHYHNKISEKR